MPPHKTPSAWNRKLVAATKAMLAVGDSAASVEAVLRGRSPAVDAHISDRFYGRVKPDDSTAGD